MENILQHSFRYGRETNKSKLPCQSNMSFHRALEHLTAHETFRAWRDENPDHYLVHGFLMLGPDVKSEWQVGFYHPNADTIAAFAVDEQGNVMANPPSEAFKQDTVIKELQASTVAHDVDRALADAEEHRAAKYPGHEPARTIVLLQHLERGQIWNITFVTKTFAVCNVKLDAATHEVLHSSCETLLAWGDMQKGERQRE